MKPPIIRSTALKNPWGQETRPLPWVLPKQQGCTGVPVQGTFQQQGSLTLKLTLMPAMFQPVEVKGEETDAISQANRNLSNHLDKTALEFTQSPLPEGDCASTPC